MIILWTHKRHPIRARYGVSIVSILDKIDFKLEQHQTVQVMLRQGPSILCIHAPSQWEMVLHCNAVWANTQNDPCWETGRLKIERAERGALKPKFLNEWMNERNILGFILCAEAKKFFQTPCWVRELRYSWYFPSLTELGIEYPVCHFHGDPSCHVDRYSVLGKPWQMHGQVLEKVILGQCSGISGVVCQKIVIGCSC